MHALAAAAVMITLGAFLGSCSGGGDTTGGDALPRPIAERYPVDGAVDLASVGAVHRQAVGMKDAFGNGVTVATTTLRWAAANDDRDLYLAFEWDDATPSVMDPVSLTTSTFDCIAVVITTTTGTALEEKADVRRLIMTRYGSFSGDQHVNGAETPDDTVGDGRGKMSWSAGTYHAEFLIPLTPDAAGEDSALNGAARFNVVLYDDILLVPPSGNAGAMNGGPGLAAGTDTTSWAALPYATPGPCDQPAIPPDLTGLIVFISDHENPLGELYTFDPATKVVTRVTHTTGRYLDCASLSHDHTRIAVHAAPTSTDFANYEIYSVSVANGTLTSLTTNSLLDGHPAWSPDDSMIAYASFRDGWNASIVTMTSATGQELRNLTPPGLGYNENDPDWLPTGDIVFKTNRFNLSLPVEMRIATMRPDGTLATRLTNSTGTSDHDPAATDTVTVFERFTRDTDYSQDPSFMFSPWNIVEARLDGNGERTLVADGWVNWLPVYDPSRRYLVYLKTVGYTDARLMDANGRDLGRLIPGITRIRYIDWK